ncbi:hypothetical protein NTD84_12030 [Pseudomonas sp. 14P_8.1_Bac3]|uniref:hypothetical protein n=1 Tax=Pseudomonas sp. 14P_8.1_Bac3 TaxID=2971621 RepID=UPI0021C70FC8|nr:hypothetical protein [Pseudomonas sp. 14P_8.1_Bac3]MCU1760438.1 hypothetical protein [Pseudomonas sp. 14P_8.1_Bac3]
MPNQTPVEAGLLAKNDDAVRLSTRDIEDIPHPTQDGCDLLKFAQQGMKGS